MSDLISRSALLEKARVYTSGHGEFDEMVEVSDVKNAPAVDAVPVVRCRECKHGDNHCDKRGFCSYCNIRGKYPVRMNQDDFCSYGERNDNG